MLLNFSFQKRVTDNYRNDPSGEGPWQMPIRQEAIQHQNIQTSVRSADDGSFNQINVGLASIKDAGCLFTSTESRQRLSRH